MLLSLLNAAGASIKLSPHVKYKHGDWLANVSTIVSGICKSMLPLSMVACSRR